ncbi:MAG: HrpE/YscL family type III secretion apparatus protein [Phycisphaerae bacterium]|jgi:vacuolar-type H+-ATPase subunit E/Vma4|nr:HrpE/YscL family type III secretion apparatus protein [Phycisphaerae bacterium]
MAESIETFVAKLQTEGVQAGRQEADAILATAKTEAENIVSEANSQADKIVAQAKTEAENLLTRGQTELSLAARDAVLKLQETLSKSLQAILRHQAGQTLEDVDFLGKVLHELILLYAKDELTAKGGITFNVSSELREKLADWALKEIGEDRLRDIGVHMDLHGTLAAAGFEYSAAGATIEVTLDSVVETLTALVGPELRKVLESAASDTPESE